MVEEGGGGSRKGIEERGGSRKGVEEGGRGGGREKNILTRDPEFTPPTPDEHWLVLTD